MKKTTIYTTIAPVIALFAVGCSSPVAMQSTEYDDMYYSSSDRTEYVQPQTQALEQQYAATGESAVNAQPSTGNVTDDYYADEYYDGRTYRPQATWNTPNYAQVDPYWTTAHVRRMNRYNAFYDPFFYDPFMSPFYDPFMYDPFFPRRGGMMVSISMGYGWGGGWNRWGNPYGMYDPFFGSPWGYRNNYYSGFYHGYHHGFYGGGNTFFYDRPIVQQRQVQYGPRDERSGVPATGGDRVVGRPDRTQSQSVSTEQRATQQGVDYARPSRVDRSGTNTRGQEPQQVNPVDNTKQVLPSRPASSPQGVEARPSRRQPGSEQPAQRMSPAQQQQRVVPAQQQPRPIERRESTQPVQRQERMQPVQRTQPVQRMQPVQREQRSSPSYERSQPVRSQPSYQPSRSSGTSSPPARTNTGGGGRPGRGGN